MRTLLLLVGGLAASAGLAGSLAAAGHGGSIPLALLASWTVAGWIATRAADADAAAVDRWRAGRRAAPRPRTSRGRGAR